MRSNGNAEADAWTQALARAVRARRKKLELTQHQLSTLAGCGPAFVFEVESGRKATLRLDKLLAVLNVLGLQLVLESGTQRLRVSDELRDPAH